MDVVHVEDLAGGGKSLYFNCPGCECTHRIQTGAVCGPSWSWNLDRVRPTFSPSVRVSWPRPDKSNGCCHFFVHDGAFEFLSDCTHSLAGQRVEMVPWE